MSKPVVVIADSNESRCRARRAILERAGFHMFEVAAVSTVLPCVAQYQPVLVLLAGEPAQASDICRRLKAEAAAPLVLYIAAAESAPCAGADIYLREPLGLEELAATVSTCARLRWREAEFAAQKQAEAALNKLNENLTLADRRKDEFLAMLAHELRNPLAPIRAAVHILRELGPEEPRLEWARNVIDRQVNHLVRLVDDLLDVSRLVQGKIGLKKESVNLADVLEYALEASRPLIQEHRHDLVTCLPGEPLRVSGDPVRLTQIFQNLLNNASKYTPEGGRLRLEAYRENDKAVIRVRDTGAGMTPDLLPHVFELFTQAERSLDRSQGGLGIGLTLVKKLVELHGGEIEARSEGQGQGSEFIVNLPLNAYPPIESRAMAVREAPRLSDRIKRIAVVDDNEDAVETLALLLELDGHQVKTAHDGPTLLELAPGFRPDVVLLDIGLPGMDGYEVAKCLRACPETRDALLIAITGYGRQEDKSRMEAAGFDHRLVKPIDPDDLGKLLVEFQSRPEGSGGEPSEP
jgi:signal transduction histidine kinase/ActR/RegA family two-component response regulator